jgi:hypothetical protein
MPNWVTHRLDVSGEPKLLARFLEKHFEPLATQLLQLKQSESETMTVHEVIMLGDGSTEIKEAEPRIPSGALLDFETILPLSEEDDASEVWGTKWSASMGRVEGDASDSEITIWFDTPWSIPEPIFEKLADLYPGLTVKGIAFDEMWNFATAISIENGEALVEEGEASVELYRYVYGKEPENNPLDLVKSDDDPRPLNDLVKAWLEDQGWSYEIDLGSDTSQIRTSITLADESHTVIVDMDESDNQVASYIYSPIEVSDERLPDLAVLLNRRNFDMMFGRFAAAQIGDDRHIQWKGVIDVTDSELTAKQFSTLIGAGVTALEEFSEAIKLVASGKGTPDEAFDKFAAA